MRLLKLIFMITPVLGRRKNELLREGGSLGSIMSRREQRDGAGGRLFGGGGTAVARRPFGHARVIPPHIPAAGARHNHGTVFIFDCDGDLRRDPDRRGTRGANVVPFRSPVFLERRP